MSLILKLSDILSLIIEPKEYIMDNQNAPRIFISYSHADEFYLKRLIVHLAPYERRNLIDVWSDTKIRAGDRWLDAIQKNLSEAKVAILLISADFLASSFIAYEEIPIMLKKAQNDGIRIMPVIIKPCAFVDMPELNQFQSINVPSNPLIAMSEADKEALWVKIAKEIAIETTIIENKTIVSQDYNDWQEFGPLSDEINNPAVIQNYYVYQYHHMDWLDFMTDAHAYLKATKNRDEIISELKIRFRQAGWEGDGNIELLWFPPFIDVGIEDTIGFCVWHVKQGNNGTSWIASSIDLPFERLKFQN